MKHLLCLLLIVLTVYSDDAIYEGGGDTVFPISTDQIQMLHERVICIEGWQIEMTATYKNFGPATTVQMGFPFQYYLPDSKDFSEIEYKDPHFRAYVNGKSIPVTLKRSKEHPELKHINYPAAYTFNVHFDKNEEKTISHKYVAGGFRSSIGDYSFTYILETGALWKDSINKIDVEFRLSPNYGYDIISPQEHSWHYDQDLDKIVLSWTWTDIEPDFNIEVNRLGWFGKNSTPIQQLKYLPSFLKQYGKPGIRYLRNLIFAQYGFPFKHPIIRSAFYDPRINIYSENDNYSEDYISTYHKKYLKFLNYLESKNENFSKDMVLSAQQEFPKLFSFKYPEVDEESNIYIKTIEWAYRNFTLDRNILISDYIVETYKEIGIKYLRNLVYAHYGYPFSNEVLRELFYYSGRYSENDNYSEKMISTHHKEFIQKLIKLEKKDK